jgi:hypothetical protein
MNRQMTIILTILSAIILSCSTNETNESKIAKLLPEGTFEFEVLDSVKTTPRQEELTYAFQKAYQENMDIFNQYFEKVRKNEDSNFPANDYLTKEDFEEYMEYANNIKLIPSTTESVKVKYSGDKIDFESSGKLDILNYLTFNTSANTFQLENYNLTFKDSTVVTDKNNALQESWSGHIWEFAEPKDMEIPTHETIGNFTAKRYKVTIGTLKQSGKTFMIVKGQEYNQGQEVLNFEIPIRMKK